MKSAPVQHGHLARSRSHKGEPNGRGGENVASGGHAVHVGIFDQARHRAGAGKDGGKIARRVAVVRTHHNEVRLGRLQGKGHLRVQDVATIGIIIVATQVIGTTVERIKAVLVNVQIPIKTLVVRIVDGVAAIGRTPQRYRHNNKA